ncbi:hypothetical protein LVY72_10205 [Arthrobacter sp. I2-34]|uniref:SGNH hydrolase-type esterase domain-containing protein n=1 Tax=Arthrobacter hankyongi TaxID=2904801 RepID=A0ABS9L728_9MICC|nr:hypothetical protein [Arthrobacter hankyongi]MCG2622289.1 hypothetical protein [Arthrobacter hankyongi]
MSQQAPILRRTAMGLLLAALPFTAAADIFEDTRSLLPGAGHRLKMAWWGSSTMERIGPELELLARTYGMQYFNGGAGGQTAEQTLARLGSRPALMDRGTIPASGPALLTTPSMSAAGHASFTAAGSLAGIPGTLSKAHGAQRGYTFRRSRPGRPARIPEGTPFVPAKGREFRTGINHLNIGKNNLTGEHRGTSDPGTILRWTYDAYDWLSATSPRVLVWGHFVNTGTPEASPVRGKIRHINEALKDRYGPRFVDLDGLLTHLGVWEITGVRPAASDLREQALGNKPPSLSLNSAHMNATGYKAVRHVIEQRLGELAWLPPAQERTGF